MPYFNTYGLLVYDENELMHVGRSRQDGAKRGSGRYPLGSGDRPYQHGGGLAKVGSAIKKVGSAASSAVNATRETYRNLKHKRLERMIDKMEDHPRKFKTKEVAKLVNQMSDEELNARIETLQKRDVYKELIGKRTFSEIKQERHEILNSIKTELASSLVHQVIVPGVTGLVVNKLKNKTYDKAAIEEGNNASTLARNRAIDQINDLQYEVKRRVEKAASDAGFTDRKAIDAAIKKATDEKVQKLTGGMDPDQWVYERSQRARESAVNEFRKANKPNPLEDIYKNTNSGKNPNNQQNQGKKNKQNNNQQNQQNNNQQNQDKNKKRNKNKNQN